MNSPTLTCARPRDKPDSHASWCHCSGAANLLEQALHLLLRFLFQPVGQLLFQFGQSLLHLLPDHSKSFLYNPVGLPAPLLKLTLQGLAQPLKRDSQRVIRRNGAGRIPDPSALGRNNGQELRELTTVPLDGGPSVVPELRRAAAVKLDRVPSC